MNQLLIAVIIIIGGVLFLAFTKGKGASRKLPYQLSKYLLSKAERSFYGVLVQATGGQSLVFSKVRVADAIIPKKGINRSDWQRAFNAVSSKHFDFLICDSQDCSIRLAVELDDSSHNSPKGQKRDNFINSACESAGLPLLRVKAAKGYVVSDIQRQIEAALLPHSVLPDESAPVEAAVSETSIPNSANTIYESAVCAPDISAQEPLFESLQGQDAASPSCPKCGELMLRRKSKSYNKAGREFWGCSTFPKCRGTVKKIHNISKQRG